MIHSLLYQAGQHFQKSIRGGCSAFWSHASRAPAFLAHCWAEDRKRLSHAVPVLMGLGIAVYFYLPEEPSMAAALSPLALTVLARHLTREGNRQCPPELMTVATWIALGFAIAAMRTFILLSPQVVDEMPAVELIARIVEIDTTARGGQRFLVDAQGDDLPGTMRLRLSSPRLWPELEPGDWVRARADIRPLPAPVMPGGFDFGRKLWFEGVRGTAFTIGDIGRVDPPADQAFRDRLAARFQRMRDTITGRILAHMSERTGPVAAAFLTGERSGIDEEDNQAMQASSLSHLLSISGLHMMLAGFGVFAAIRYVICLLPAFGSRPALASHPFVKKGAAIGALLASLAYLLLSGASIPTQRAFVTVAVAFIAILADRNAISMRTVAIAATAVLLSTPEAWMDPSFQMSFCAVVVLVAAYEWWNTVRLRYWREDGWGRRALSAIGGTAATSVMAGLATAPFAAFHFNRLSAYGVPANVLVMPVVSLVIMPAGVVALLLMPLGLEWLPLQFMDWGLALMLDTAHWISSSPGAALGVQAFSVEALLLMSLGLLWMACWHMSWRWLGLVPLSIGLVMAGLSGQPDMYVSKTGGNVAVRAADGRLSFASARRARFDAEMWLRADGDTRDVSEALAREASAFDCSTGLCIAPPQGARGRIVLVQNDGVRDTACTQADIVISPRAMTAGDSIQGCGDGKLVFTGASLQETGAVSIRFEADGPHVQTVARTRGERPWVAAVRQQPEAGVSDQ
jgi:competence protein ComEC